MFVEKFQILLGNKFMFAGFILGIDRCVDMLIRATRLQHVLLSLAY